jgi:hypothetical protein
METLCMLTYRYARALPLSCSSLGKEKSVLTRTFLVVCNWLFVSAILLAEFLYPGTTTATVIVPVSETDLTQHAAAIVMGTVTSIQSYWDPQTKQICTHITVSPQDVLKGALAPGDLVLKQSGGTVGQQHTWIDGSPSFIRGERVLLFVDRNADGSARVDQLYLGKFSLFTDKQTGKEFAYRGDTHSNIQIVSTSATGKRALTPAIEEFFEVAPMKERIRTILQDTPPTQTTATAPFVSPLIPLHSDVEQREGFVLIRPIPVRWFEPDTGDAVILSINPDNSIANGEERINTGMETWNAVPGSTFIFQTGTPTDAKGFRTDGVSAISFADPLDQLTDPIRCTGILAAVALMSITSETLALQEQTFYRITEADFVYADGWDDCKDFQNPTNIDEVTTHELGHVLGLGHSPNPESIMFTFAHFDGRGAVLAQEDRDGVAFLYPDGTLPPCTYALSSTGRTVNGIATTANVNVSTSERCGWTAFTDANWITITAGEKSSGNDTVEFEIAANPARKSRQATVSIAGRLFTVTQKAGGTRTTPRKRVPPFARA